MNNTALIEKAKEAMKNAYAPYSKFRVGCALLSKSGKVFTGCNVENASYGGTICAERTALVKAVSEGERNFETLAVTLSSKQAGYPCGICRQFMSEFGLNMKFITEDKGQIKEYALGELLPKAFTEFIPEKV